MSFIVTDSLIPVAEPRGIFFMLHQALFSCLKTGLIYTFSYSLKKENAIPVDSSIKGGVESTLGLPCLCWECIFFYDFLKCKKM